MQKEQKTEAERLEALYKVSTQLGSTLDLSELLNLVIDAVIQLTGAERGFVVLVDEWGRLKTMAARNVEQETIGGTEIPISRTIVQRVVATGEPVLTSNAQEDARFADRRSIIGYQFRSIMSAPLRARDRVTGAVFVDNHMLAGVFNDEDLDLLVTFANQAAISIDNARLFQQTDQALSRRVEELSLFQQIDRELHTAQDLSRTINLVLEWASRLTKADATAIGILSNRGDPESSAMQVKTLLIKDGVNIFDTEGKTIELSHPTLAKITSGEDMVQLQNVASEQSFLGQQMATQLTIPVKLDGKVLGFLALESQGVSLFFEEDIEFIRRLSDRAAVAIGNSHLYEQLNDAIEDRTKFISIMTHELRLPLTSIRGYSDLLSKQLVGPLNEQQVNFMQTIQRNVLRMSRLISDLSDLNRAESDRMNYELYNFDLKTAVIEAVSNYTDKIEEKKQTLNQHLTDDTYPVYIDYAKTVQVIDNLLENAHKYTPEMGQIDIHLSNIHLDDRLMFQIQIVDNGLGMNEDEQNRAFEQFFRSEDQAVRNHTGWGLGLPVAKMLANGLGGTIQLESTHGTGTAVTFLLPSIAS